MHLTGIIDAQALRAAILARREALRHPQPAPAGDAHLAVLQSIDARLATIAELLRARN